MLCGTVKDMLLIFCIPSPQPDVQVLATTGAGTWDSGLVGLDADQPIRRVPIAVPSCGTYRNHLRFEGFVG
jgi:hypothetical protein